MNEIVIFCDSCSSLTKAKAQEMNIKIIPTLFFLNNTEYNPLAEDLMSYEEYYEKLEKKNFCKTSCINPDVFIQAFEQEVMEGRDVLYISLSSGLSSSHNNAILAKNLLAETYDNAIEIIDPLTGSFGVLFALEEAVKLRDEGLSALEIKNKITKNQLNVESLFTIGSLDHLRRGGRLSTLSAIFGTILNINPVIRADKDGKLSVNAKLRGRKKAFQFMLDKLTNTAKDNTKIYIGHTNAIEDAEFIKSSILENTSFTNIEMSYIDHTMGAHCGPKTIAMFFIKKIIG